MGCFSHSAMAEDCQVTPASGIKCGCVLLPAEHSAPPPPKVSCLILQYSGPCCIKVRKKWAGLCNIMYIGKLEKIIVFTHEASCTCAYDGGLTVEVDGQG